MASLPISRAALLPCRDAAAERAREICEASGSLAFGCWTWSGFRIIRSIDPAGPGCEPVKHVSVSNAGEPVSEHVARHFARMMFPDVADWDCTKATATHLWEKLKD